MDFNMTLGLKEDDETEYEINIIFIPFFYNNFYINLIDILSY